MKLGVVGKGGVGKTTLSALIAQTYAERGKRVLAIDTDFHAMRITQAGAG
ncbi:MAG: AAA family ATPase [Actinobacteria bacterium]|nr:AAA family ATPase [Actinomycetota bacterium]